MLYQRPHGPVYHARPSAHQAPPRHATPPRPRVAFHNAVPPPIAHTLSGSATICISHLDLFPARILCRAKNIGFTRYWEPNPGTPRPRSEGAWPTGFVIRRAADRSVGGLPRSSHVRGGFPQSSPLLSVKGGCDPEARFGSRVATTGRLSQSDGRFC